MNTKAQIHLEKLQFMFDFFRKRESATRAEFNRAWDRSYRSDNGTNPILDDLFSELREELYVFFGIEIEIVSKQKRGPGVRYGITNKEIYQSDKVLQWMMGFLEMRDALEACFHIHDRVILDTFPSSNHMLRPLANAIYEKRKVYIDYAKYGCNTLRHYKVKPYYIVSYRNRLYLLCIVGRENFLCLAMDRIKSLKQTEEFFEWEISQTAEEFLRHSFSCVRPSNGIGVCDITLRAYGTESYYMEDVPFHRTQQCKGSGEDFMDYSISIYPTMDFYGAVLQRGERLEIVEPQPIREEMKCRLLHALSRYYPSFDVETFERTFAEKVLQ